ncbi:MAG: serine/threonine-protein kinase, partial [Planctomycetota bacterium]
SAPAPPQTPPAVPPPILRPGDVLGGCVVERFVARGGMGELYRARKANLDCPVALKVLLPELLRQESTLTRFLREAKLAANLSHPSIVRVYDVGQERGLYYLVMEFVEGRDLRDIVTKDGPLPYRSAFRIARQIADALEYAHRRGVVHRDVKPANILVSLDGVAKLTDLGLARLTRQESDLTLAGEILGTPIFMSPEQCRGDPIDGRTDLYSLGATLYMLLSGSVPFRGDSAATILHKVLNERPPSLKSLVPELPEKAVAIVQRLMAKHPSARYQTGREVVGEVNGLLLGRQDFAERAEPAEPVSQDVSPGGRASLTLGVALVASALLLLTYALSPKPAESLPVRTGPSPEPVVSARGGIILRGEVLKAPEGERAESGTEGQDASPAADPKLKERVEGFLDSLKARNRDEVLGYVHPGARDDPLLQFSMLTFFRKMAEDELSPEHYLAHAEGENRATVTFELLSRKTGKSFGFPTAWMLVDGTWYMSPDRPKAQARK